MRTVLVPFHDETAGRSALDTAAAVAHRFAGYLEGLLVQGGPLLSFGPSMALSPEYLTQAAEQWRSFADRAREQFAAMVRAKGIDSGELETQSAGPIAGWREMQGQEADVIGSYGRLFDLIVIGRPDTEEGSRWQESCESALFESGRPVVLAARQAPQAIGRQIVIAWNGSTETARAVALAMPLLATAERVVVLSVDGGMTPGPAGRDLAAHLLRAGVPAEAKTVDEGKRPVGAAILEECAALDADLLVKGAYTRSRLRQVIFGGATEHVMRHARLPVLLAH